MRYLKTLNRLWQAISIPVTAVVIALLIGALILYISGINPLVAYGALFEGALGEPKGVQRTIEKATPLIFSGLAVAFAFKAGLFNIGAQGQLVFGALTSAVVGFMIPEETLPALIHIPLALLAGAIAGGLYGALPGYLKTATGAHEVITTIMLNFIALNITDFLADGPLKDPSPTNIVARTPKIVESARIPLIGDWLPEMRDLAVMESGSEWAQYWVEVIYLFPIGFFLSLVMVVLTAWLLWRTTLGYEIRTVGQNANAARYAGIKVARTVVITMAISGALAGLGGAVETQGVVERFEPGFNVGLGFDGITIALLGKTNPYGVVPAALLVGAMKAGSSKMQFDSGTPPEIVDVILAIILFFIAAEVIIRWILRQKGEGDGLTLTSGWGGSN
ncbi:MAG: ABC transporter permease [Chloroflexota bacterium]